MRADSLIVGASSFGVSAAVQHPLFLFSSSSRGLGVLIETEPGDNHDLVVDEGADHKEDETEKLKGVEVFLAIDELNHPDEDCTGGIDC